MFILLLLSQMNVLYSLLPGGVFSTTSSPIKIRNRLEATCRTEHFGVQQNAVILPTLMHVSRLCPFSGVQNTSYTACDLPQCPAYRLLRR